MPTMKKINLAKPPRLKRGLAPSNLAAILSQPNSKGAIVQAKIEDAIKRALRDLDHESLKQSLGALSGRPDDVKIDGLIFDMSTLPVRRASPDVSDFSLVVQIAMHVQLHGSRGVTPQWQALTVPAVAKGTMNGVAKVTTVEPYQGALASFEPWVDRVHPEKVA